ncbi:MAG: putative metal-binding protein [uncultured archaeon A07HR60]|jgi:Predicted metal-binding protein|nr:MAG: putative metal-binding protein [uncultured archaeon A07HR60]
MNCRRCGTPLQKPGDYCLTCHTANTDAVVLEFGQDRATLTMLSDEEVRGETTVATVPETDSDYGSVHLRNFAGRVADEVRRKRPETVYAAGVRDPLRETRAQLHHEFYRVPDEDAVEWVLDRRGDRTLEVVETPPREKLGGTHSTLIGDREGRRAISTVADHPHVKKIIPGPIDAGGIGSQSGLRAKVTRADETGNVRLLLRDGSSVQENRLVTTAMDRETGERVRDDLNDALEAAELQESR